MLGMSARRFFVYNVIGGVVWTDGILLAGYLSARKLRDTVGSANIDKYILPAVAVIVVISVIPIFVEILRTRRDLRRRNEASPLSDAEAERDAEAKKNAEADRDSTRITEPTP
jgi:membrane-associated protein